MGIEDLQGGETGFLSVWRLRCTVSLGEALRLTVSSPACEQKRQSIVVTVAERNIDCLLEPLPRKFRATTSGFSQLFVGSLNCGLEQGALPAEERVLGTHREDRLNSSQYGGCGVLRCQ